MPLYTMPAIESQPEFPTQDITDANAEILGLILSNDMELRFGHAGAEQMAWFFRFGHTALRQGIEKAGLNNGVGEAIDHGIITYEAICMLVGHLPDSKNGMTITHNAGVFARGKSTDLFVDYVSRARLKFDEELPLTAGVIAEASARPLGILAPYAIHGAALARQFELDSAA